MLFLNRLSRWWRDAGRNIFRYHDGTRRRRADPAAVGQRLETECPQYVELLEILTRADREAPPGPLRDELLAQRREASEKLADVAYKVFDLKPLDDHGGVTKAEAVAVLTSYFVFMENLARDSQLFRTSPAAA